MHRRWRNRPALLPLVPLAIVCLLSVPVSARASGELNGKTLKPSANVQSGLQSALGSLLAGSLKGEVTEASVITDQERRVTLTVRYTGFEGAKIWVEVAGSDKRTQKLIRCGEPQTVAARSGDLEFTVELDPAAPENTTIKSTYLRVCASRGDRATPSYVRGFQFPKTWVVPLNPETLVLTIAPKPVGSTASLGATPPSQLPLPPKVIRPDVMRGLTVYPGVRLMTVTPAPGAAPPPASSTVRPIMSRTAVPPPRAPQDNSQTAHTPAASLILSDQMLGKSLRANSLDLKLFGVPAEAKRVGAKGPSGSFVEPLGQVRPEDVDLEPSHILGVFPSFY